MQPLQKKDLPVGWKLSVVLGWVEVSVMMVVMVDMLGSGCWGVGGALVVVEVVEVVGFFHFVLLVDELPSRLFM